MGVERHVLAFDPLVTTYRRPLHNVVSVLPFVLMAIIV
jgi:hypothetical protein